jgi:hypothetical protein
MTSKKAYFNSYLKNALRRKEENRQNFKDLYFTKSEPKAHVALARG